MKLIIFLVSIVLLVSGCDLIGPDGDGGRANLPDVYVGEQGLTVKFVDNAPPEKLVTSSDIEIRLMIKNKGAVGVENQVGGVNGAISLSLNDAYLVAEEEIKIFTDLTREGVGDGQHFLFGRENLSSGESRIVSFDVRVNPLKKEEYQINPTTTILATVCYPYKTFLSAPVCVDQNPYGDTTRKSCEMNEVRLSGGQGAPVAVTRIEQGFAFVNDRVVPQFKIFVENVGEGDIVQLADTEKACGAVEAKYTVVHLESASLSGEALNCDILEGYDKPTALLDSNQNDHFLCRYSEGFNVTEQSFYTELSAEFSYGYVIKESKKNIEIDVVKMPEATG